jgi:opacity protein-like surface antigen
MKKTLLIVALVVLALGALGVGVVVAQGQNPPTPGSGYGMMGGGYGGYGWMHDYVEQALAAKLGLTEKQVEDALASGATMYQIALDNGIAEADLPNFMADVHQAAFDQAVADGVLSQEQADWMGSRGFGRGGMTLAPGASAGVNGYGYGNSTCPMFDGDEVPSGQPGTGFGPGMMGGGRGGRWQQAPQSSQY